MALYIQNPEELKRKLGKFNKDNFHVVSDFDKTLTKAFVQGKKVLSSYSLIREGNYLSPDYVKQAYALFDKYHPYEISNTISLDKKKKYICAKILNSDRRTFYDIQRNEIVRVKITAKYIWTNKKKMTLR